MIIRLGFKNPNSQEPTIQPTFQQLIDTSLALIHNATSPGPTDEDFSPFDVVAP